MDFYFDEANHDITSEGQDLKFADETNIVKQRLNNRLQFFLGEWFLDNTIGVPYSQKIFVNGTSLGDVYDIIRKKILDTDDVESIKTLGITPTADGRHIAVVFEAIDSLGNSTGIITIQV